MSLSTAASCSVDQSNLQGNIDSKKRETDSAPWWEELPSHIANGVGRMPLLPQSVANILGREKCP